MTAQKQKDTDIACLEQHYGSKWLVLTYIGPDRNNLLLAPKKVMRGGSMRVRYLAND